MSGFHVSARRVGDMNWTHAESDSSLQRAALEEAKCDVYDCLVDLVIY